MHPAKCQTHLKITLIEQQKKTYKTTRKDLKPLFMSVFFFCLLLLLGYRKVRLQIKAITAGEEIFLCFSDHFI